MTTGVTMTEAAMIAHRYKRFGRGLGEFRDVVEAGGPGFCTARHFDPPIPGRLDVATAEKSKIELKSKMPWGVDGGDRTPTKIFEVRCHSGSARFGQPDGAA